MRSPRCSVSIWSGLIHDDNAARRFGKAEREIELCFEHTHVTSPVRNRNNNANGGCDETIRTDQGKGSDGLHSALVTGDSYPGAPFVFPAARLHIELGSK